MEDMLTRYLDFQFVSFLSEMVHIIFILKRIGIDLSLLTYNFIIMRFLFKGWLTSSFCFDLALVLSQKEVCYVFVDIFRIELEWEITRIKD